MKKILSLSILLLSAITAWAAKANTIPTTVIQSDGTHLTVIAHGDENGCFFTTTDGILLERNGSSFYVAQVNSEGTLSATSQLAHEMTQRNAAERYLINTQNSSLFYSAMNLKLAKMQARKEQVVTDNTFFPHTGTPKALVILVDFTDTVFKINNPRKAFEQYLNGTKPFVNYGNYNNANHGSVAQYFSDMSGDTFRPQFELHGPIRLSHTIGYYGNDERMDLLIPEACKAMDDSLDFSQFDANKDGKVDLIYIICAGYAQSASPTVSKDQIWPKSGAENFGTFDNTEVFRYGICTELNGFPGAYTSQPYYRINGIGLFCHEFSHCLGLPDFYPTTNSARIDNQAMEYWDLMDGGEYLSGGRTPTPYTAWEKEAMGWLTIDTLKTTADIDILPLNVEGGKSYRIMNDNDATGKEYFIVENIQNTGWNNKQEGHGLLVYHVNYNASTFSISSNSVNNTIGKPGMTIVPADGKILSSYNNPTTTEYYAQLAGDPFPGTSNIINLNDTMNIVNFQVYTGAKLNKALSNISENTTTGVIRFHFISDFATGIKTITNATETSDRIYTIDGQYVGKDKTTLKKGIYIIDRKKIIIR